MSLLLSVAGPLQDAIELHQSHSVHFWENALKAREQLESAYAVIWDVLASPGATAEARQAAATLKAVYDGLAANMASELALSRHLATFQGSMDQIMKAATTIELIENIQEKHNLLVACKLIKDFFVDRLKDLGLQEVQTKLLQEHGMPEVAQLTSLGKFVIDYGYNSLRFYLAWSNIHDILGQLDHRNALAATLGNKITDSTKQLNALRAETQELNEAQTSTAGLETLRKIRLNEMQEACLAGKWFTLNSAVHAPSGPTEGGRK